MDTRITASPLLGPLASSQLQLPERNYAISITLKACHFGITEPRTFHFEVPAASRDMAVSAVPSLANAVRYAAGNHRATTHPLEAFTVREMLAPREALSRIRNVINASDEPYLYDERSSAFGFQEMLDYTLRARSISWLNETQTHLVFVMTNGQVKTFSMTPTHTLSEEKHLDILAAVDQRSAVA